MLRRLVLLGVLLAAAGAFAQQTETPGSITGTVTCGDTQKPARFAGITLVRIPDPTAKEDGRSINSFQSVQTGLDGVYTMDNVPPGDYYLSASQTGYIPPMASAIASAPADATPASLAATLPKVHVDAGKMTRGDIRLERGGAVGGTVTYDDGTPVGAMVRAERVASGDFEQKMLNSIGGSAMMMAGGNTSRFSMADDRGHYRLSGLPPGEYRVVVTLQLGAAYSVRNGITSGAMFLSSPVMVYAPGTMHHDKADTLKIVSGDDRNDVNILVDLNGLHTISGHVSSAADHHAINTATVRLTDTNDNALQRSAGVDANGNYTVRWLPPGTYALRVENASDREMATTKYGQPEPHVIRQYESGKQSAVVDAVDVTGVDFDLMESKATPQKKDDDD